MSRVVVLDDSEIRRRYDETPDVYDRRYSEIQRTKYPILLDMLSPRPGETVLDLGCGTGLARATLDEAGLIAVGMDFSIGMLKRAAERRQPRLVLANCIRLPFRQASFDQLLGATVIQNIAKKHEALAEISRVLRKGGRAVLSFPRNAGVQIALHHCPSMREDERRAVGEDMAVSLVKIH